MSATDSLRAEHRQIEIHLDALLASLRRLTAACLGDIRRHFQEIRRLAPLHFAREEGVLYPRLRSLDPSLLARMDEQHEHTRLTEQYLEELLASLDEAPSERDLTELYRLGIEFHDAVQTHILDEEDHLLALADQALGADEQERLFLLMQQASECA